MEDAEGKLNPMTVSAFVKILELNMYAGFNRLFSNYECFDLN